MGIFTYFNFENRLDRKIGREGQPVKLWNLYTKGVTHHFGKAIDRSLDDLRQEARQDAAKGVGLLKRAARDTILSDAAQGFALQMLEDGSSKSGKYKEKMSEVEFRGMMEDMIVNMTGFDYAQVGEGSRYVQGSIDDVRKDHDEAAKALEQAHRELDEITV